MPDQAYVWADNRRSLHLAGYNMNMSRGTKLDLWLATVGNYIWQLVLLNLEFSGGGVFWNN